MRPVLEQQGSKVIKIAPRIREQPFEQCRTRETKDEDNHAEYAARHEMSIGGSHSTEHVESRTVRDLEVFESDEMLCHMMSSTGPVRARIALRGWHISERNTI